MPFQLQPDKIATKLRELNLNGTWNEVSGLFAVTQVEAKLDSVAFNPGTGVVVKLFVNTRTGEMKMFPANLFE